MRRVIAIIVALALAGAGTFFLVRYIQSAEARALEGEVLVKVLVVDQPIEAGTPAEEIADRVRPEQVPTKVAVAGAVEDLTSLEGKVAAIALLPGDQVTAGRFVDPETYRESLGGVPAIEVPPDLLQVTLSLSPERVLGGELRPGDIVAVFASFDPFALNSVEPTGLNPNEIPVLIPEEGTEEGQSQTGAQTPNSTKIILHRVLVSNLQVEELPPAASEEQPVAGTPDLAPTGNLLVTLALLPGDAERLVFTAEHGFVWLALEGEDVDDTDTQVQTRNSIYEAQ